MNERPIPLSRVDLRRQRLGVAPSSLTCSHRGGECPALAHPCIERQVVERAHHHALGSEQPVVVEFETPIIAVVPRLVPIQFQAGVADHVEDSLCVEHQSPLPQGQGITPRMLLLFGWWLIIRRHAAPVCQIAVTLAAIGGPPRLLA